MSLRRECLEGAAVSILASATFYGIAEKRLIFALLNNPGKHPRVIKGDTDLFMSDLFMIASVLSFFATVAFLIRAIQAYEAEQKSENKSE